MITKNQLTPINSEAEFNSKLKNESSFIVYKHSSTCNLSAAAKIQVQNYLNGEKYNALEKKIPFYEVLVLEQRPLSNAIANISQVTHQSPQILWFKNGDVCWNVSHKKIKQALLEETLN